MPLVNKPQDINKIWSSSGDRATPSDQKISQGWVPEIPPYQWFNYIDHKQDQAIAHINQHGIAVWDAETEYFSNKSYVQDPDTGDIYRSRVTNKGRRPTHSPQYWERFSGSGGGGVGPHDRTTSRLTTVTTSWVTQTPEYRTTSALTSYVTSWTTATPVYTLSSISSLNWGTGWMVGDIATVTGGTVAPGYGPRRIRIVAVDGTGKPTSTEVESQGGYTNSSFPSGGFSGRGSGSWSGGVTTQIGTYNSTTSTTTSKTTTWNTMVGSTSVTTSATTSFPTSWTTIVEEPEDTANILIIGQSNVANYGEPAFEYVSSTNVTRLALGGYELEAANSPATGQHLASGNGGNMDGLIGDKLIASGRFSKVRIFNLAVGGTSLLWWNSSTPTNSYEKREDDYFPYTQNRLFERVQYAVGAANAMNISFSHILIHIGETDAMLNTPVDAYVQAFDRLKNDIRGLGVNAPFLLGRVSYVDGSTHPSIIEAQNRIIAENSDVYPGPNTDTYLSNYRYDSLHWSVSGLQTVSTAWANSIVNELEGL